jgi:biopolymer transport protein ExbB/TolQ
MNALILVTDVVEKLILLSLFGLSIWSLSIIFDRKRILGAERNEGLYLALKADLENRKMESFQEKLRQNAGFLSGSLQAALQNTATSEKIDRAVSSFVKADRLRLEKGLSVLATLGANAPFIGLFGTVLGIIRSFAYLGSQSGSSAVMSGVSQALYATAFGLFVAIPAVVSFNIYSKKIRDLISWTESLRDLLVAQNQSR